MPETESKVRRSLGNRFLSAAILGDSPVDGLFRV